MITKYAFLKNNTVMLVDEIDSDDYSLHINHWDSIIDVSNLNTLPQIGWILFNNVLIPVNPDEQQSQQQTYGTNLALTLVNMFGSKNLALIATGETVNVTSLLNNLALIKMLLEVGALKTARTAAVAYKPAYPAYADVFQKCIDDVTSFLITKGWN